MGTRLKAGQAQFAQPFADRALLKRYPKSASDFVTQIHTTPAHHMMHQRIWTRDDQLEQFLHLGGRQLRCWAGSATRYQTVSTDLVVTMHPIAQSLPVHARLPRRILAATALQHHGNCQ